MYGVQNTFEAEKFEHSNNAASRKALVAERWFLHFDSGRSGKFTFGL